MLPRWVPILLGLLPVAVLSVPTLSLAQAQPTIQEVHDLGKGTSQLDGQWQFHVGDDSSWAAPQTVDATGANGWEQLSAVQPWGAQGHPSYTGYGWYRKHISFAPAAGGERRFSY